MKVLDLRCGQGHRFEGWFGGEADFAAQVDAGLLVCPVCGAGGVEKLPSAVRLNLGAQRSSAGVGVAVREEDEAVCGRDGEARGVHSDAELGAALRAMRQWVSACRDVGEAFAAHALAMHRGEMEPEAIRGRATPAQARELAEEGVRVLPLPDWPGLTEPLQ